MHAMGGRVHSALLAHSVGYTTIPVQYTTVMTLPAAVLLACLPGISQKKNVCVFKKEKKCFISECHGE